MDLLSPPKPNRKELYREFLRRFNPGSSPGQTLQEDLIEASLSSGRIAKMGAALVLKPGIQLLLVGGIGSGKSTECQLLQKWLSDKEKDVLPIFLDVSKSVSLELSKPGSILLSIAIDLIPLTDHSSGKCAHLLQKIRKEAFGFFTYSDPFEEFDEPDEEDEIELIEIPGKLAKPHEIDLEVSIIAELLNELVEYIPGPKKELILILDGMDRVMNPTQYWQYVDQDFAALKHLGLSLISTAPLSLIYGQGREVLDHFSQNFHITPIPADKTGLSLLKGVLTKRKAQDLLSDELMEQVCDASGGVLRDLISLVETAAQNAYLDDEDQISQQHLDAAVMQLGDNYKLGLSEGQRRVLIDNFQYRAFDPAESDNLQLLLSRRVLERSSTFKVHPALLRSLKAK